MAYMDESHFPRMVQDSAGNAVIPSAVYFDDSALVVGEMAVQQSKFEERRFAQFMKVHMGDPWMHEYAGKTYTPESLSAIILKSLVEMAVLQIGPIHSAVVTVPAYFNERRRLATQHAGEIAGLDVIGTLHEPMAATLAYGLHCQDEEQTVLVYDLGGGTFDVSIVKIAPGSIREIAVNGNRQLGGRDWDECVIDYVSDNFLSVHHEDPRDDAQLMQKIRIECETAIADDIVPGLAGQMGARSPRPKRTFQVALSRLPRLSAKVL